MFEFESKHFILAIGVMLLLSGAIIFYFQNRVGSLEKAIAKQNQVLSSFIANVQSELRGAGPPMVQAPQSAPGPPDRRSVPSDKIEVSSDDYDSDSDSDSSNTSSDEGAGIRIGEEEPDVKVIEMLNEAQDIIKDQENAVNVTEVLLNDMIPQDMADGIDDTSLPNCQRITTMTTMMTTMMMTMMTMMTMTMMIRKLTRHQPTIPT